MIVFNHKGQSLLEVIVALAIFALIGAALATMSIGGLATLTEGAAQTEANAYAQEGLEAVRAIRDRAWNELIYTTSSVSVLNSQWIFDGEDTSSTFGNYNRVLSFEPVCRDGSDNITTCPSTYTDIETKKVTSEVFWYPRANVLNSVKEVSYLTNWGESLWLQTDWVGGSGQSIWSSITKYDSDDGSISASTTGEVRLKFTPASTCGPMVWDLNTQSQYTYDSGEIEVVGGFGQLKDIGSCAGTTSTCPSYTTQATCQSAPECSWTSSYSSTNPTINNSNSYNPSQIAFWSGFFVSSTDNGGTIYYQLSSDDGVTWKYWNGTIWATSTLSTNYNTSTVINANISTFPTSTKKIMFKAFLSGSGTQQVKLDQVQINCTRQNDWTFDNSADYTFDSSKIIVSTGTASLKLSSSGSGITGINDTVVDTLEYDTTNGQDPDIIKVTGSIYLMAFRGPQNDGWVKTVNIDNSGNIGASTIDSLEFDTSDGYEPSLIQISATIYAVAYRGNGNDGWVKTFSVDGSGNISNAIIDSLEFDTADGWEPDIIQVGTGYYAVAYRGVSGDGFVKSFTIDGTGNIGNAVIDTLEWDTADGMDPDIINIFGTMYVISYAGTGEDGFVVTFTIDATGNIANTITDSYEYDPVYARTPDIKFVTGSIYMVVHQASSNPGSIEVDMFEIQTNGDIASVLIDSWLYDTNVGLYPKLINVGDLYWAIVYEGTQNDGYLATLGIGQATGSYPTDQPTIYPVISLSVPTTSFYGWTDFAETALTNGGSIFYQLSNDDGVTWKYWNSTAWATVTTTTNYNSSSTINTNIATFPTSTGKIMYKAFLVSNGSQLVQLDNVAINWMELVSTTPYATLGSLISSAFNMSNSSPFSVLSFTQNTSTCSNCSVKLQMRVAPDNAGAPGTWGSWFGASGIGSYFTEPRGTIIPKDFNWQQWVQYRAELSGDGQSTPSLQEVKIKYK